MRGMTTALVLAAALVGSSALAAKRDQQGDTNVFLRGGVGDYTGDLGAVTAIGPMYGLVVNVQPFNILGVEIGYDGSRNALVDDRLDEDANVLRNGASAMIKLAPPLLERVRPFVGAGLGASYVSVQGETGDLYENDLMEEIPLTAGLEFNSGALHAGLRGTYRLLVDEGFASAAIPGAEQGGIVEGNFTLGARF